MVRGIFLHKNTLLVAASALALLIDGRDTAVAQTEHELPAVRVHAPTPRAARRATTRQNVARTSVAAPVVADRHAPATPLTGMIGGLPPAYAGGQVASSSQVGFLGNRGVMDTPFNLTSYTAQTIQDQQARKLDDVLANDPSTRSNVPRAYGFDFVAIRGFDVPSSAYGLNGLYGIASAFSFASLAAIERVDVLKGPGAVLNGMPPGGGVGGSINLVTKRAGDDPIAQLTNTYSSRSQFGTHLDVARRYGEANEFGIRFNGSYRNGATELANQSQELGTAALGLDYRGERIRLSADLGYEKNNVDAMSRFVVLGDKVTGVPVPPDARANFAPSWGYWRGEGKFGLVQGEVDITDGLTAYAQAGAVSGKSIYQYSDIKLTNINGEFDGSPRLNSQTREQVAAQAGFRAQVDTGPFNHAINFNATVSEGKVGIVNTTGTAFTSNIYSPRPSPTPLISVGAPPKTSDSQLSSFGIADTISMWDKRVQFTVGLRQQYVESNSFSAATGLRTGGYDASAVTPAYALVVKPRENVSLYANYIEGLESGTVVGVQYANAGDVLAPYRTRQYEAGVKVDWGRVTTTLSAFDINRPLQLIDVATNTLTQGGESRNRGVELNAFGELAPGVRLLGGMMFINARQERTQGGKYDGYRTFSVPDTQLNLGGEWDVPFVRGLTLTGRAIYTGSFFADQVNALQVASWTRYDAGLRYTFASPWNSKPVVVRFQVENLFDKNYWQGANTDRYVYLGAPRTYLLSTTFNF